MIFATTSASGWAGLITILKALRCRAFFVSNINGDYHGQGNLAACLSVTLEFEGGYVDHPKDPGGATNMGITHKVLASWRKVSPWWALDKSEVKNLKRPEVEDIYAAPYWRPMRGDGLTRGVDLAAFDYGVKSGISRASRHLQATPVIPQWERTLISIGGQFACHAGGRGFEPRLSRHPFLGFARCSSSDSQKFTFLFACFVSDGRAPRVLSKIAQMLLSPAFNSPKCADAEMYVKFERDRH